ncbi:MULTISPECIES: hypothetical protein [unclassified Rhizobium]|uniref:hypothetical protein n=1 Tax=unclassified Rhizobium TaxID=2613769 RepID=UPI0016096F63|nr:MULTISPECIES: hypothetical protein [unclassified Rhizobium]MBB3386026.1 hypothetical protein [Rhizobium sp. BK098]MBB3617797.1 hypothetical protein [Rhizobium sp. BK609]MBB3683388.1 hypothetical protein [Rhizobium sp. BK612]
MGKRDVGCPHKDIRFCPLYHAAHMGGGFSCDDGQLELQTCAVARGISYRDQVEKMRVAFPGLVEQCEWREKAEQGQEQRRRNMRLLGLN